MIMKEKILEIIKKNSAFAQSELLRGKLAEEIAVHVMEFVEWLCFDQSHYRCGAGWRLGHHIEEHNINEMYQYWWDNVKNK